MLTISGRKLRRKRLHAIGGGLRPVMWAVVLIGAVLTISVTYLLQIEGKVQVTLTAFFAMFIGLVLFGGLRRFWLMCPRTC